MIKGLRTMIYHVSDFANTKASYGRVLEREPCFEQPFYVGYEVGGFELGLLPDGRPGPGGTVAYWGVADAAAAVKKLEALGAVICDPLQEVGEGIRVATVTDPFENTFGVIENPNFSVAKVQ
jgi:predicted enzyme related to lactoylglutathione lyase